MADDREIFKLDLDSKDFIANAKEAQKALSDIADAESLTKLVSTIGNATLGLAAVATAAYGFKKALDFVEEAEAIKRVNAQFEMLTANAGIASDTLKEGLEKAAAGLVDTEDLLQAANKALVTMGGSAEKLPQLLEAARNSTLVFGGTLTQNFEALNQAIATGQTRALRHLGIIIDSQKAYRDYADSIGVTVSALDETEKKQAILNAVLEKSQSTFKNNQLSTNDATFSVQKLSVSLKELKDTFVLAFDRTIGPSLRSSMASLADFAKGAAQVFAGEFGTVEQQTDYQIQRTESRIKSLTDRLSKMDAPPEGFWGKLFAPNEKAKARIQSLLDESQAKLEELKARREQMVEDKGAAAPGAPAIEDDSGRNAKRLAEKSKFEASLQELTLQRIKSEEEVATSVAQINTEQDEKIIATRQLRDAKLRELDAQRALQEIATDEELNLKKQELTARTDAEIVKIQEETDQKRIESLRRFAEYNKSTMAGFTGSMRAASAQAAADMQNFSKLGSQFTNAFAHNATSAFKAIGDGSKSAADAMGGFMLGTVADMAEAYGSELLLSGLWPPNPLALGAGAALITLSGFLRSKAGGSSAGLGAQAAASSVSGATTVPSMDTGAAQPVMAAPSLPASAAKREVQVNIMGHYFETPETRRMLVDMLRQESDSTQFTIAQIGQGA
jgi:hypothetical protein